MATMDFDLDFVTKTYSKYPGVFAWDDMVILMMIIKNM